MQKDYTHIVYVIDESGSMQPLKDSTIKNYSNFITDQQKLKLKCTFSLYRVKTPPMHLYGIGLNTTVSTLNTPENEPRDLNNISSELVYFPDGGTPLYDVIGEAIDKTGAFLAKLKEQDRPGQVIFIIDTDGYENASKIFNSSEIKSMIEHQQNKYNWKFLYFGANQDSFATAKHIGINLNTTSNYQHDVFGNQVKYTGMSVACGSLRSSGHLGAQSLSSVMEEASSLLKDINSAP